MKVLGLCAWTASANASLDCRYYVIEQNSSAQGVARREVVITTRKYRHNGIERGKHEDALLTIANCCTRLD